MRTPIASRLGAPGFTASALSSYLTVGGQAVRTLVLARLLGPADFGLLNLSNIAANVTVYSDVGGGQIGEQRASEARGRHDVAASEESLRRAAGARLVPALLILSLALLAAGTAYRLGHDSAAALLLFVGVSAPAQAAWQAVRGWLRVHGEFRVAAVAQGGQVLVWLTLVPAAAVYGGLYAALFAMAFSFVPPVCIGGVRCPLTRLLRPRPADFAALWRPGIPVFGIFLSSFLFINLEQILAGWLLGTAATGLIAIGTLTANALLALSDGAAAAGHPQTLEAYARHGRLPPRLPSVFRVLNVVQLGFGVLVPLSWLGTAWVTATFLPAYEDALPVIALLGASAAFLGMATASNASLLAVGLHRWVPVLMGSACVLKVALGAAIVAMQPSIVSLGIAALASAFAYSLVYLGMVARAFRLTRTEASRFVLEQLSGPLVLAVLAAVAAAAHARSGLTAFTGTAAVALAVSAAAHLALNRAHARRHAVPAAGSARAR